MPQNPLILTLTLDAQSQQFFNRQRQQYFPPERNYLDAHLTLFHQLPPNEPQLLTDIELAVQTYKPINLQVSSIKSTGNGVAYVINSNVLMQLHQFLQKLWSAWLIPQDQHKLWPHITIQNKVDAGVAVLLKAQLEQEFMAFEATGTGLSLFEYQGGPWKFVRSWEFAQ